MKHAKKLFTLLLAFLLVLAFGLPAMAIQTQSAVDWDEFYIVKQPQGRNIRKGESFTLSFEVNVPDGVEVEYKWFGIADGFFELTTSDPILVCSPGDAHYPILNTIILPDATGSAHYHCWIYCYEKDGGKIVSQQQILTNEVTVDMKGTIGDLMYSFLNAPILAAIGPFAAVMPALFTGIITYPFIALYFTFVMPIMALIDIIGNYVRIRV